MTNKQFFLEVLKEEAPKFRKAIEALPEDKHDYKVHERARSAGNLAGQLAIQWKALATIATTGIPSFNPHEMDGLTKADMLSKFDEGMPELMKAVESITDEVWETGKAGWNETMHDTRYHMSWMFLFDAIHHRGQLLTFLRAMGAKVPSIYGPSADDEPTQ
ncbi:MAG: DinB family protein [Patescibacteria group bacterium]